MRLAGDGRRLLVLETKGKQLDNDDTAFKRALLEALQGAYRKPSPGKIDLLDDSADVLRFQMLMQELDWTSTLAGAVTSAAAEATPG